MKSMTVVVPWEPGLHLRPAVTLVLTAAKFRSSILLSRDGKIANLRNILSVIALCATMGTALNLEVAGEDEQEAARAVEQVFASTD